MKKNVNSYLKMMAYCGQCDELFSIPASIRTAVCPKCKKDVLITDISYEQWDLMSEEEKQDFKASFSEQFAEHAEPGSPADADFPEDEDIEYTDTDDMYALPTDFKTTSGFNFEGYSITDYLGIESGEIVMGTGFASEFSAGMNDIFGSTSGMMGDKLHEAKKQALFMLVKNCRNLGANAVIGIDYDITTIGKNMLVVLASGTAVSIKKN